MTIYLLVVSFILHLMTLLCLFALFQRRAADRLDVSDIEAEDLQSIRESMASFVNEMERENREWSETLVKHVSEKEQALSEQLQQMEDRLDKLEIGLREGTEQVNMQQNESAQAQPTHQRQMEEVQTVRSAAVDEPGHGEQVAETQVRKKQNLEKQQLENQEREGLDTPKLVGDIRPIHPNVQGELGSQAEDAQTPAPIPFEENLQKAEELYKQGFTAAQIARLLRIGNGESQLIVHMLQRK